jgi:two-component system C4-dicarboxylate transport sensor histidine kinase DctB
MPDRATGRLAAYVATGVLLGAIYVVFDLLSEARLESGTLTGTLAGAHFVIDHALPLLAGGLLGVSAHYVRVRAELTSAREAASRGEALRERLHKVERDQAVWVLTAAVLHELNNPLHALGLLLDELALAPDAEHAGDLTRRARIQMDRALSQLALLRAMRSRGEPELARIPLDAVIRALAGDITPLAVEDGLAIRIECDRQVVAHADAAYVRTILENLVDNSLHSLRGRGHGSITIRLGTEGVNAVIRVEDDGPSIAEAVREALFEPLRTTKTEGLGLGLPIARALARAMRGDLLLDDTARKAFRLELPLGGAT